MGEFTGLLCGILLQTLRCVEAAKGKEGTSGIQVLGIHTRSCFSGEHSATLRSMLRFNEQD